MAKSKVTTSKAIDEFSQQAKTALYILGGQAVASQANKLVIPAVLKNQSPTIQQVARAGVPLLGGIMLALTVENKYVRGLSLGFGTQGVLEAIKLVMPNFSPAEGFNDGSHFVYQASDGSMKKAAITKDGQVITEDGSKGMLPEATSTSKANAGQQSKHADGEVKADAELSGWSQSQYEAGMEMEQV